MGLFENLVRIANKFGVTSAAIRFLPFISLLSAIGGIAWLLVLPIDGQYRNTYISENALLPAQAHTYFRETEWNIVRGYREEVNLLQELTAEEQTATLMQWMSDIGLKVSTHDWQFNYRGENRSGTNVYGILHAPRGDNTEAMVLVAPWINQDGSFNNGGISLLISLARYFKKWSVWSKNIIFVAPSDSYLALRYWVRAYHTSLENTAGSIEGAIVLDYPSKSDYFDNVEILYEGLNGQLPNLDLINTATLISMHESLKVVIQGMDVGFNKYQDRALTLLRGIWRQLLAGLRPGPGSESFSGWRIDAITLRARGSDGPADITTFGRIAESSFRSINNLLEHFHQSFFFYFLLAPKNFVSIGTYLPAAMSVAISFPLMAIYIISEPQVQSVADRSKTVIKASGLLVLVFGLSALFGFISLQVSHNDILTFFQTSIVLSYSAPIVLRLWFSSLISLDVLNCLQSLSMIGHGLFLTTLSTLNFSLAVVLGLSSLPLAWVRPNKPLATILPLVFLSCPWTGILALSWAFPGGLNAVLDGLLTAWLGMDVWTWGAITAIWLPAWIVGVLVGSSTS